MGQIKPFQKEKLVMGLLLNSKTIDFLEVKTKLEAQFGLIDLEMPGLSFDHTAYYEKEMGTPLFKHYYSFEKLIDPSRLAEIKILTQELEKSWLNSFQKRRVNLDPGLLSLGKLILATTKNYTHRIPLQKGIYAEITLVYQNKEWQFLPWTYPDFKTIPYLTFFNQVRTLYHEHQDDSRVLEPLP